MLSDTQKKEYMEIMHEFADLRSELEALMYPDLKNSEDNQDQSVEDNQGASTQTATNHLDRLSELRNQLQS